MIAQPQANCQAKDRSNSVKHIEVAVLSLLLFLHGCAGKQLPRETAVLPGVAELSVKVNLLETDDVVFINSHDPYIVKLYKRDSGGSMEYISYNTLVRMSDSGRIMIDSSLGAVETGIDRVSFVPEANGSFLYLNGRPYRGELEVLLNEDPAGPGSGKPLWVLNTVRLEDYLKGVVPAEIGSLGREEFEALKAQAVAARTYAISRLGQYHEGAYDLKSSVEDQVYAGVEGENALVSEAIRETEDLILTHRGEPIHAYYHSNCGGMTEHIERVWDKPEESYLVPVEDDYCGWSRNFAWEETWDRSVLESSLSAYLDTLVAFPDEGFGTLEDLEVWSRSPSGRIEVLEATTSTGKYRIFKDKIRWAMRRGNNRNLILESTLFDLEMDRGADGEIRSVKAKGRGNGHGVGMCQTGVIGMARQGYDFWEILSHFYRGAELTGLTRP